MSVAPLCQSAADPLFQFLGDGCDHFFRRLFRLAGGVRWAIGCLICGETGTTVVFRDDTQVPTIGN